MTNYIDCSNSPSEVNIFKNISKIDGLTQQQIEKITARLPELYRASLHVGHSTSQASYALQTMTMLDDSPLSRMKQCLSQIHHKRQAAEETYFKIEKMKIEIKALKGKDDELSILLIHEKQSLIDTLTIAMQNTVRQMGMFQDMYDTIRKNNNISENWTEQDYEKQEIQNMIRRSFRLAIQDISQTGTVSKAAVEFWEQLGIHPQLATNITLNYFSFVQEKLQNKEKISIKIMHDFLDKMVEDFKDSHKDALKRIGLDELGSEQFMASGATKPQ